METRRVTSVPPALVLHRVKAASISGEGWDGSTRISFAQSPDTIVYFAELRAVPSEAKFIRRS